MMNGAKYDYTMYRPFSLVSFPPTWLTAFIVSFITILNDFRHEKYTFDRIRFIEKNCRFFEVAENALVTKVRKLKTSLTQLKFRFSDHFLFEAPFRLTIILLRS